jgi:hypothetical protein
MTKRHATVAYFQELAGQINRVMNGVHAGWQALPDREAYQRRVDKWHDLMTQLYDGLYADLAAAQSGDPHAVERLVIFLEADVVCHRSGYFKGDAIKVLTRVPLTPSLTERLEHVLLVAVDGRDRREFRAYVRLARALDTKSIREQLGKRLVAADERTRRHTKWVIDGLATGSSSRVIFADAD